MKNKVTVTTLGKKKRSGERIVCLTAYDYTSALIADTAGVDLILVGDSLGNVVMGDSTTLAVELEEVEHHLRAVRKGVNRALLVADLPFGTYGYSVPLAVEAAVRLMKAGAEAVKIEGCHPATAGAMINIGIPVMGHVGFTPQSIHLFGEHRVRGKGQHAEKVKEVAKVMDEAGVFGIVLEVMPAQLAKEITLASQCATIGIGAGINCDGEIQVWHDVLGLWPNTFKHARRFAEGHAIFLEAVESYSKAVRERTFPGEEQSV